MLLLQIFLLCSQVILQIDNRIVRLTAFLLCELNLVILSQSNRVVVDSANKHIKIFG